MGRFEGGGVISELEEMGASKIIYACICVWINLSKREGVQHATVVEELAKKKIALASLSAAGPYG